MLIFSIIYLVLAFIGIYHVFKNKKSLVHLALPIFICLIVVSANLKSEIGVFGLGGAVGLVGVFLRDK